MNDGQQNKHPQEEEIDLLELALKVWAERKWILKCCGYAVIVGLVIAFSIPKEYTATATIAPELSDVKVPAHDYVKEIFEKYDGDIPTGLCIQHFNKYLKVIMREIGLTDKVSYSFTQGGKLHTVTKEKWELISSHTARRSAATNMYLTGRMKTLEIMKLTGHRSEHNFFRYIRLTGDDTARSISGDMFFRK